MIDLIIVYSTGQATQTAVLKPTPLVFSLRKCVKHKHKHLDKHTIYIAPAYICHTDAYTACLSATTGSVVEEEK